MTARSAYADIKALVGTSYRLNICILYVFHIHINFFQFRIDAHPRTQRNKQWFGILDKKRNNPIYQSKPGGGKQVVIVGGGAETQPFLQWFDANSLLILCCCLFEQV